MPNISCSLLITHKSVLIPANSFISAVNKYRISQSNFTESKTTQISTYCRISYQSLSSFSTFLFLLLFWGVALWRSCKAKVKEQRSIPAGLHTPTSHNITIRNCTSINPMFFGWELGTPIRRHPYFSLTIR